MNPSKSNLFIAAAVAGIISAGALSSTTAFAADKAEKGHCMGANKCKGKTACAMPGQNECAGKNGCGGKGFLETTQKKCDKLAKKNPAVKFEAAAPKTAG